MLKKTLALSAGAVVALAAATMTVAESHVDETVTAAVEARHAHMDLYAYNLGLLGGMAQGEIDYDAEAAQAAADNLLALASLDQSRYWPEGSDNATVEDSRALAAIWEDMDGFMFAGEELQMAAQAMADVAGTDLAALQGAIQGLGAGCGGCHRNYRLRDN